MSFDFAALQTKIRKSLRAMLYLLVILIPLSLKGQTSISMHSGTMISCSALFYDSGGASGNYNNNENDTLTITSASGSNLHIIFSTFSTQAGFDVLSVYDGSDLRAPLLGQYSGTSLPPDIISSGPSLTFRFVSNGSTSSSGWAATVSCPQKILYSYQNGNWNNPDVWTTDPSGTVWSNPTNAVPGVLDKAVIRNARKVTATANGLHTMVLRMEEGGILDLASYTGHTFDLVTGKGQLRIGSGTFPSGDFSRFTGTGGGTVEYYGGSFTMQQVNYFNLVLNLSSASQVALMKTNNFHVLGIFDVKSGTFQINDNTASSLTLAADSDLIVDPAGRITVGNANVKHDLTILGDLVNNGNIKFTTRTSPNFLSDSDPRVHVHFTNNKKDQSVQMNGPTVFYRIHCLKGVDDTYVLNLDASDTANFKLYGPNNIEVNSPSGSPPNIRNNDALGLEAGTLRLGANIIIPALASSKDYVESGSGYVGCNYYIDSDATLWIDGATVNTSYYLPPSNHIMSIMSVYGKLRITSGYINDNAAQGIGLRITGQMVMEGGTVNTRIIRTSAESSAHRGAYTQTGGSVIIRRDFSTFDGFSASFHLGYTGTSFTMSGGTIDILRSTPLDVQPIFGTSGEEFIFCVSSDPKNINISGGTITLHVGAGRNSKIATKGYFNNLVIVSDSSMHSALIQDYAGSSYNEAITAIPLQVNRNFSLQNKAVFNAASYNVLVGGDFKIESGASYVPGTNTTILNGSSSQLFTNAGTITPALNHLTISNKANVALTNGLNIAGNLDIRSGCYLQDMGQNILLSGNLILSGSHVSQGNGRIQLEGSGAQTISGNGSGVAGNLSLNKTGGSVTLGSNLMLTGNLRLANSQAILDLGPYNLRLGASSTVYDALSGTGTSFSASRMIRTDGNLSSGGLTRDISLAGDFLYPLGVNTKYTPALVKFSTAPTAWGNITVRPVNYRHPLLQSPYALKYFWKVTDNGFSGITSGSMTLRFTYLDADTTGKEASYIPAVYNPVNWFVINNIAEVHDFTNEIYFQKLTSISGDYTAGEPSAFEPVKTFYSRASGNWSTTSTWTNDTLTNSPAVSLPGATNPVIIRAGHTVTIPASDPAHTIGSLKVKNLGILDLTTSTGHNFGAIDKEKITGTGTIRISSAGALASFPMGDFGLFLGSGGGTVDYYTTGSQSFGLPIVNGAGTAIPGYNKLRLSPGSGQVITFPDADLAIHDSLFINGAGIARMNGSVARHIVVERSLVITAGTLEWNNNLPVNLEVSGDLFIAGATSVLQVRDLNTAADNMLILHGNLVNKGTLNLSRNSSRKAYVTFTGLSDNSISGNGATTNFYSLTLDKGTDMTYRLIASPSVMTFASTPGLILLNGTFLQSNASLSLIPTTTTLTIPATAQLALEAGTMNLCTGASDNNDIFLSGRLSVAGGTMNIGNPANSNNNDIEYSAAGLPMIEVSGGAMNVNGQIRRHPTIVTGALVYMQSGGVVTIYGKNRLATRALLEVENPLSRFEMTGGNLVLVNGGGTTFGDLSLIPDDSKVTGGSVQFGSASTTSVTFNLFAACPVFNLNIFDSRDVTLQSYPLEVNGDLSIGAGTAYLNTNGLQVSIGGNFSVLNPSVTSDLSNGGYRPMLASQLTRFNGSAGNQLISGSGSNQINFGTVLFANTSAGKVWIQNTRIRAEGDVTIGAGILDNANTTFSLLGDFINYGKHQSGSGFLSFIKTGAAQNYFGEDLAECGNIRIDNESGLLLVNDMKIAGILNLSLGSLYLGRHLLVLESAATVTGASGSTRMILTNGALSDAGLKKEYASGAGSFIFPIGVTGRYSPVSFSVNSTKAGSITVKPINEKHPGLYDPPGNELLYYWNVVSSGFLNPVVTSSFTYTDDVVNGTESSFVTDRYFNYRWQGSAGTMNNPSNTFTFSNVNYIDGEYTAGAPSNFVSMPRLYSVSTGSWNSTTNWSASPSGVPSCNCIPNGNPVTIKTGHTITVGTNGAYAYSVDLPAGAILNLGQTIKNNLGHVAGGGTIQITSTSGGSFIFPGGEYNNFFGTVGSTVEYTGSGALPPEIPVYQNVTYNGPGTTKSISAFDFSVLSRLYIHEGYLDNSGYGRMIKMKGNWRSDITSGFIAGRGLVTFEGGNPQSITANGGESFYNLRVKKSKGEVTLLSPAFVNKYLILNAGYFRSSLTSMLSITNQSSTAVMGGSDSSFVIGPLRKMVTPGSKFEFPVGDLRDTVYRFGPMNIGDAFSGSNNYWQAQYFWKDPGLSGMSSSLVFEPIQTVSSTEYWTLSGPSDGSATKTIRWDGRSDFIPLTDAGKNKLRLVEWALSHWQKAGEKVDLTAQTVGSDMGAPLLTGNFTIGLEALSTAHITGTSGSLCNDGSQYLVPVAFTGDGPWSIGYSINGTKHYTISNIGSSPYNIVISSDLLNSIAGPGVYTIALESMLDKNSIAGVVYGNTVQITLLKAPVPSITGKTTVNSNESGLIYSTPADAGSTFTWTVTKGTIAGGQGTNAITVNWGSITGAGEVKLVQTLTATGCTQTVSLAVNIVETPAPDIQGSNFVCSNDTLLYTTPVVSGHTYTWTVQGGSFTSANGMNSIRVLWLGGVNPYIAVLENSGTAVGSDTIHVMVNPQPPTGTLMVGDTVCLGDEGKIGLLATPPGLSYGLYWSGIQVGDWVPSLGGGNIMLPDPTGPVSTKNYSVKAWNTETGCKSTLSGTTQILVFPVPDAQIAVSDSTICLGTNVVFTASGGTGYVFLKNGTPVQSGALNTWSSSALVDGDKIAVVVSNIGMVCSDTSRIITMNVDANPVAGLIQSKTEICAGENVVFTASGAKNYDFYRNTVLVQSGTSTSWNSKSLISGDKVTVIASMVVAGCADTASSVAMIVHPVPVAVLKVSDSTLCTGNIVTFNATGGSTYNFLLNGVSVQNGSSSVYSPVSYANGDKVSVIATDASAFCSDTSLAIRLNVDPVPVVTLVASDSEICSGQQVNFKATGAQQYAFFKNGSLVQSGLSDTWTSMGLIENDQVLVIGTTAASGCSDTSTVISMTVHNVPSPGLSVSDSMICAGMSVTFTASGGGDYSFVKNGTVVQSGISNSYSSGNFNNGDMVMAIVTASGSTCSDTSRSITLLVDPKPDATLYTSHSEICLGQEVIFTAYGGQQFDFYHNGTLVQTGLTNSWSSSSIEDNDAVSVIASMLNSGCADTSSSLMIPVHPVTVAKLNVSDSVICEGTQVIFNASGGLNYDFIRNGISVQAGTDAVFTASDFTNGEHLAVIVTIDAAACGDTSSEITMTVNPVPTLNLTVSDTEICAGTTVNFTASGGQEYNFVRNGTLEQSGTSASWSSNALADGDEIQVIASIINSGCSDTSSVVQMKVHDQPAVTLASNPAVVCEGRSIAWNANGGYSWTFMLNGSIVQVGTNSQWIMNSPSEGDELFVIASGSDGFCTDTSATRVIHINPLPTVLASLSASSVCAGELIDISASGADSLALYSDGIQVSDLIAPGSFHFQVPEGIHHLLVSGISTAGCSDTSSTLTVEGLPVPGKPVILASGPLTFAEDDSVLLSGPVSAGYAWSNGQTGQSIVVKTSGVFTLTVNSSNGCASPLSDPVTVAVTSFLAKPLITADGPLSFCSGNLVTLTSTSGEIYEWSNGESSRSIIVNVPGIYSLVTRDHLGHVSPVSDPVNVTVYSLPSVRITDSSDVRCNGGSDGSATALVSGGSGVYSYHWNDGQNTTQATSLKAGNYTITVTDEHNCEAKAAVTIRQPEPLSVNSSTIDPACPDLHDGEIDITVSGGVAPYLYSWSNSVKDSLMTGLDAGDYQVNITDAYGCNIQKSWQLNYVAPYCLIIYGMFTPNNDGHNDTWEIDGTEAYPDMVIEIFDRWGKRVFYSKGYQAWDGKFEGAILPMDSYHYVITLKPGRRPIIGNVTIVR